MTKGAGGAALQSVEAIPRHSEAVIHTVAEGQAILSKLDNGYYYSQNPIGTEIWSTCDGNRSLRSVVDQVCANLTLRGTGPEESCCTCSTT
jgi:hypothetical protein